MDFNSVLLIIQDKLPKDGVDCGSISSREKASQAKFRKDYKSYAVIAI